MSGDSAANGPADDGGDAHGRHGDVKVDAVMEPQSQDYSNDEGNQNSISETLQSVGAI